MQPWVPDGTTSEDNLCALCPHHHDLKEQLGWQVVLHPDRRMEWITPTGHHYWSRPVDHRTPAAAEPPETTPPQSASPQHAPPRPVSPRRRAFEELSALGPPDPDDPPPF